MDLLTTSRHTLRTPTGQLKEVQVPDVVVSREDRFFFSRNGERIQFSSEAPCGEFLDCLLGVVFSRPPYLRPESAGRYASLIDDFRTTGTHRLWWIEDHIPVRELQLKFLGAALHDWADDKMSDDNHPLMCTFAFDAARFIMSHASGCLAIAPMVAGETGSSHPDLATKRRITGHIGGLLALARTPKGAKVCWGTQDAFIAEDQPFVFVIERCHLSESWGDFIHLRVREQNPPHHDLESRFSFVGGVFRNAKGLKSLQVDPSSEVPFDGECEYNLARARIPVRWIDEVLYWEARKKLVRLPVPRWTP